MGITTIHSNGLVMALLQWHMVYKFSEDELQRPPVVALTASYYDLFIYKIATRWPCKIRFQ